MRTMATPTKDDKGRCTLYVSSLLEIEQEIIPRIRPASRDVYKALLPYELATKGFSGVDRHAFGYNAVVKMETNNLTLL